MINPGARRSSTRSTSWTSFSRWSRDLVKALAGLRERLQRQPPTPNEESALRERLAQLGAELEQLRFIAESKDARDLGDVLLCLSVVGHAGNQLHALQKLSGMYAGLAQRRRMSVEVLGEFVDGKQERAWLLLSGLGAYRPAKVESD